MTIRRWDWENKRYTVEAVPSDRRATVYCDDMERVIECVTCGRRVKVGETYTSMEVHNSMGFGYMVCEECYNEEMIRRFGVE